MVYNVTDCRTRGNTLMKEEKNMQDNVYVRFAGAWTYCPDNTRTRDTRIIRKEKLRSILALTQQQTAFM